MKNSFNFFSDFVVVLFVFSRFSGGEERGGEPAETDPNRCIPGLSFIVPRERGGEIAASREPVEGACAIACAVGRTMIPLVLPT